MRSVAVILATAVVAVAPAAQAATPKLRLVRHEPLVVRGEGFRADERVVLTALTSIGPRRAVVRATSIGRLGATFRLPQQPCGAAFAVRAVGALGSRALLSVPTPPCVPPPRD